MNDGIIRLMLLTHIGSTLFMTGLIWFVQVVHYPLFGSVGDSQFTAYEGRHTSLTSFVVGPPMLIEIATALALIWVRPDGIPAWMIWAGLALLVIVWLSTAFLQVPYHETLSQGFNADAHNKLVITNWIRTISWSLRGLLVLWMAYLAK